MSASQPEGQGPVSSEYSQFNHRELSSSLICSPKVCIDGKVFGHRYSRTQRKQNPGQNGRRVGEAGEAAPACLSPMIEEPRNQEGPTM